MTTKNKHWTDAAHVGGKHGHYVDQTYSRIAGAHDEKARLKAFWEQLKANGDDMIHRGASTEEFMASLRHIDAFKAVIYASIKHGVDAEPTAADIATVNGLVQA